MKLVNTNVGEQREQARCDHNSKPGSRSTSRNAGPATGGKPTTQDNNKQRQWQDQRNNEGPESESSDEDTSSQSDTSGEDQEQQDGAERQGQQRPNKPPPSRDGASAMPPPSTAGNSGRSRGSAADETAPSPPAPWTTVEIAAISEAIGQRCAGGSAEYLATDEPGLDPVQMEYMPSSLNQSMSVDLDETRVFDMRELVSEDIDIREGSQIRSRDVIQFVLLARQRRSQGRSGSPATPWFVPDINEFHDLQNKAECTMIEKNLPCFKARKWSNLWGKVGLIGLLPKNPEYLRDYRTIVEATMTDDLAFTLFPRDAVENRGSVSVVLREQFRSFNAKCLPASLFNLNRGLSGSLRVTHIKTYTASDKTRAGTSKEGWRLLLLQGCPQFMRSLEKYDEDERFQLGSGYIYIRGGARKPRPATSSRNNQGRTPAKNGTSNSKGRGRSDERGGSHDEEFPRPGTSRRDGQRNGGRDQRNRDESTSRRESAGPSKGRGHSFSWGGP